MWNRLKSYIAQIEKLLQERPASTDWDATKQDLLVQIGFFQHERLIHLLVTLSSVLLMVIFLALMLLTEIWLLAVVFLILFVLLIFYFVHYYRLENGVQKLIAGDIEKMAPIEISMKPKFPGNGLAASASALSPAWISSGIDRLPTAAGNTATYTTITMAILMI